MKKTTDDELNQWHFQYPSTTVSWNFSGDPAYCQQFIGEAKNMLYQLKNRMNIAVPKLKSLQDIRLSGGTTIIVRSIYGQDFINIDASRAIALGRDQECTITFYDFPLYVPPMQNPGEIKLGEVQGVDYFKTYYSIDVSKCLTCQKISWEFLFRYLQSSPLVPLPTPPLPISTRIEWPIEPLHHHDYDEDGLLLDHDGTDHTIYSMSPPAWGEVISHGTDSGGTYIIWKSYTETGQISRTGLGIMRLVARIKDDKGIEICAQNERIEVDCCLKDVESRPVEIWWEDFGTCQPYIMYGGEAICKMPTSVPVGGSSGLIAYSTPFYAARPLYGIPEIKGSCLPLEWILSGPIKFVNSKKDDNSIYFQIQEGGCNNEVTIKLKDRCETEYIVRGSPCCEDAAALSINYTSLLMSCNQQQTFTAIGGCSPYSWAITAGGGTLSTNTGGSTVYTAPATNANCVNNPTIQVTDCCGSTAQIKLALNCYYDVGIALEYTLLGDCGCGSCNQWPCAYCSPPCIPHYYQFWNRNWKCDGTPITDCKAGDSWDCIGYRMIQCKYDCICEGNPYQTCATAECGGHEPCGTVNDFRSVDMKEQGCCPLNPFTGLPYD